MPRPLTPKSFENEDPNRPRSTTPRAYSPFPTGERPPPQGILRRGSLSNNTRALPRTDSPVFVGSNRRKNEPSFSHSQNPSYDRDRPLSPLSLAGSPGGQARSSAVSRNDDWKSNMSTGSHYRDGSSSSSHMYTGFTHERSFSGGQSLSAPALPDSPLLDMTHPVLTSISESTRRSPMGSMDFNSPPILAHSIRSGLASPGHSRFQASIDAFDRPEAGSRTLSPKPEIHEPLASPLVLTSLQNSSQISLLSTGSSYHSIRDATRQASDAAFSLISRSTPGTTPDTQEGYHPGWVSSSSSTQVEEALQLLGLTQENLVAMQDKLVQMASPDLVLTPQSPVLRRRKNSIPNRVSRISAVEIYTTYKIIRSHHRCFLRPVKWLARRAR
jgi:serine/arginine repetitive matrix protein 2